MILFERGFALRFYHFHGRTLLHHFVSRFLFYRSHLLRSNKRSLGIIDTVASVESNHYFWRFRFSQQTLWVLHWGREIWMGPRAVFFKCIDSIFIPHLIFLKGLRVDLNFFANFNVSTGINHNPVIQIVLLIGFVFNYLEFIKTGLASFPARWNIHK